MSGGKSDFLYTDDKGTTYALNQDTSNATVVGNIAAGNDVDYLPRRITPRKAIYKDSLGLRTRTCYPGTNAQLATIPATFDSPDETGNNTFTLRYTRGEKAQRSRSVNTGIIP